MIKLSKYDDVDDYSLRTIAPDLTPLIDIIFILIVFLILTANPAIVELMVDLPKKQEEKLQQYSQDDNAIILKIKGKDNYYYNDDKITDLESLRETLSKMDKSEELIIAGDKKVSLDTFLRIMAILEELQIKNTKILMGEAHN